MTQSRILMTGSRQWNSSETAQAVLVGAVALFDAGLRESTLVHGAAAGADTVVATAASGLGMQTEAHPAQWSTHTDACSPSCRSQQTCRVAGFRRNAEMITAGADVVLAFPAHGRELPAGADHKNTSRGTWDCTDRAAKAGLPTIVVWGRDLFPFNDGARALIGGLAARRGLAVGPRGQLGIIDAMLPF